MESLRISQFPEASSAEIDGDVEFIFNTTEKQTKRKKWSGLSANLSLSFNGRTVASVITANNMDFILADATTGAFTINLPAAVDSAGYMVIVKKIDGTANNITIDAGIGYTIDGSQTAIIINQWDALRLWCDGLSWYIN